MRIFLILAWMSFAALCPPGCVAVTGPRTVTGPEGGSVSVTCGYDKGYEKNGKFWCREGSSYRCSNGEHILETNGSEAKVQKGRFSLQDNHSLRTFTVTMEHLTKADAGTYHCGVARTALPDLRHAVKVIVSPVLPTSSSTTSSSSARESTASTSSKESTPTWEGTSQGQSTTNSATQSSASDQKIIFYVLIPCIALVLILFLVATLMLVRASRKKKRASVQQDKKINLANMAAENSPADLSTEYEFVHPHVTTNQTGLYSNVGTPSASLNPDTSYQEVPSHHQDSENREEIFYVTMQASSPEQQPIYCNMEPFPKATHPASPPGELLYAVVNKKKK
ncbi:CMRF35-like molecule 6 [Alligator sinensis]|uniref:CMRF35-like molecule 6 n=1 Tax=Alligator sinensis TaxID=38654 RepID=A0A3Q0G5I3_ALLSI|nr:CMRF35-like molecule 6 [Alligator sinensis]